MLAVQDKKRKLIASAFAATANAVKPTEKIGWSTRRLAPLVFSLTRISLADTKITEIKEILGIKQA